MGLGLELGLELGQGLDGVASVWLEGVVEVLVECGIIPCRKEELAVSDDV